jgi:hypothetical protein
MLVMVMIYQPNKQSPLTVTHTERKDITITYDVGNPGRAWDRHTYVTMLKR